MEITINTVAGLCIGFLQAIIIFILVGIKKDQADIWKRINSHYHEVACGAAECKGLKTGNVIIPHGD